MCIGPSTGWPRIASRPLRLDAVLLDAATGSARLAPSPPPSMLYDAHDRTRRARSANIGASTDFTRVSPVLPSQPAQGSRPLSAACCSAGSRGPGLGVNATNEHPAR
jgi:hypothetical protein